MESIAYLNHITFGYRVGVPEFKTRLPIQIYNINETITNLLFQSKHLKPFQTNKKMRIQFTNKWNHLYAEKAAKNVKHFNQMLLCPLHTT